VEQANALAHVVVLDGGVHHQHGSDTGVFAHWHFFIAWANK